MYKVHKGYPKLGYTIEAQKVNFSIFSTAEHMLLKLYCKCSDRVADLEIILDRQHFATGDIFHIEIEDIKEGSCYTWHTIDQEGKSSKPLIDPYALSLYELEWEPNTYRNVLVKVDLNSKLAEKIPWEKTIIYEMHIGHFTKHPSAQKGTISGTFKAAEEKLDYLKTLGITSVELLPVFKWNKHALKNKHPLTGDAMKDVWGYNPISFFALERAYSFNQEPGGEIQEFKAFVDKAHRLGLEVILDVVYNHTGEGGEEGDLFNFKALAKEIYYRLDKRGQYRNCSGTGNTLNTAHTVVKKLILDSLRYFILVFDIDGFRFDLASILAQDEEGRFNHMSLIKDIAEDPIISKVKLISESWDAKGSYDVGRMPYPFVEWSDYFRDTIRKFIRGDLGLTQAVSSCILGEEVYHTDKRKKTIHFITAHDGFTLWDLTAYNKKHNELNGEDNRDGSDANYSDNCGIEGPTQDPNILDRRKRRVKNYLAMLFLSRGMPMFLMGDECARSQEGNNNAFCQDDEKVWMKWERGEIQQEIFDFTKRVIALRKKSSYLFKPKEKSHITWHGVKYNNPDWSYYSRSLAWQVQCEEENYFIVSNQYIEPLTFEFPPDVAQWIKCIDTYEDSKCFAPCIVDTLSYQVEPYSVCVFKAITS